MAKFRAVICLGIGWFEKGRGQKKEGKNEKMQRGDTRRKKKEKLWRGEETR